MLRFGVWLVYVLVFCTATSPGASSATLVESGVYRMYTFGQLGATPTDLNDLGQAVGNGDGSWNPWTWDQSNGTRSLTGISDYSRVMAINNAGQCAGSSNVNIGSYGGPRPVLYDSSGQGSDLGTLGGLFGVAEDINSTGWVVGYAENSSRYDRAFLWNPTTHTMQNLGTLGEWSEAWAINDSCMVAGTSYNGSQTHMFTWTSATGLRDRGYLGSSYSGMYVCGINNAGQVVGSTSYSTYGGARAFVWQEGVYTDLGLSGARALGINDHGQVVGCLRDASGRDQAFLWDATNGTRMLGTPAELLSSIPVAININGSILGQAWNGSDYVNIVWEVVPEPPGLLILAAALVSTGFLGRRHRCI